jgi:hypothetical protein
MHKQKVVNEAFIFNQNKQKISIEAVWCMQTVPSTLNEQRYKQTFKNN